jgi:hypothetical protein
MPFIIRHALEIHVPADVVWEVITDLPAYAEWNSFVPRAESTFVVGEPIEMRVHIFEGFAQRQRETVSEFIPGERFCYGVAGAPLGAVRSSRCHIVEPITPGRTRYRSNFELAGWLAPLTRFLVGRRIQRGFDAMATGLQARAEQLQQERQGDAR